MSSAHMHDTTLENMSIAATDFLESLSKDQKEKTRYEYLDGERLFWYYPPINRHGLPLRDMNEHQRSLALNLMSTGLTEKSFEQAKKIIALESILGPIEKENGTTYFDRNPDLYYFTIFGNPGSLNPWGWRAEGHHISLHYSILSDQIISMTPFFFGANPAEVRHGEQNGLRILSDREDIAFDLISEFDKSQLSKAVIYNKAPWDILTYNSSKVSLPEEEGLPASKMNSTQKKILNKLIAEYINQVPQTLSERKL